VSAPEGRRSALNDPFGPLPDPSTCEHEWETHFWEPEDDLYCPHCTSRKPRPSAPDKKEPA
jgi:hypothetical protein